jgi:hypothetical protein
MWCSEAEVVYCGGWKSIQDLEHGLFKELVDISSNISIFLSTETSLKSSEEKERGSLHIAKHPSGSSG